MSATKIELLNPRPTLRLWSEDSETSLESPPDGQTLRNAEGCVRTTDPASLWTLRKVLKRLREAHPHSRKQSTWDQYQTLLQYWERYWGADGPDVRNVSPKDLLEFFESVEEWATARTWKRNSDQLSALFKSACRQSEKNREGVPDQAPLRIDEIPWLAIPDKKWFKANRQPGRWRRGGHTPKRRSTVTLEEYQHVVNTIWDPTFNLSDRSWWETIFAWIWFSGMRIDQIRTQLTWCLDGISDGIDLNSKSLVTEDSKCGGAIEIPLPECLIPGLTELWYVTKPEEFRPFVFLQPKHLAERSFYKWWDRIWERAIPCSTAAERELRHFNPHELRSVSCTNWDLRPSPDDKAGRLITGHTSGDVRTEAYFQPGDKRFREIVNRFPMPKLRASRRLFV